MSRRRSTFIKPAHVLLAESHAWAAVSIASSILALGALLLGSGQ